MVEANAPLWGAEAEVCRTYFGSSRRSRRSDLRWIARQAAKELLDGVAPRADLVARLLAEGAGATQADLLVRAAEELHEEATHFSAFAIAYDRLREKDTPALDADTLAGAVSWPENMALRAARQRHRSEHGALGEHASAFTEGGYCTLYAEGMRLAGRGDADDAIAEACTLVYEDEFGHMLAWVGELGEAELEAAEWELLTQLTVEQSRLRVLMRAAQFDDPVEPDRLAQLVAGQGPPIAFDWTRAGLAP